jgi:heterodisulfide reductase subunit C
MWNEICLINALQDVNIRNCVWLLSHLVNKKSVVLVRNGFTAGVFKCGTCTASCDVCWYKINFTRIEELFIFRARLTKDIDYWTASN